MVLASGAVGPPGEGDGRAPLAAARRAFAAVDLEIAIGADQLVRQRFEVGQGPADESQFAALVGSFDGLLERDEEFIPTGIDQHTIIADHDTTSPRNLSTTRA